MERVNIHRRLYIITDSRGQDYNKVHHVWCSSYTESLSIDAFTRQKNVWPKFNLRPLFDYELNRKIWMGTGIPWSAIVDRTTKHDTVWDFYNSIGWNHKKKRWKNE